MIALAPHAQLRTRQAGEDRLEHVGLVLPGFLGRNRPHGTAQRDRLEQLQVGLLGGEILELRGQAEAAAFRQDLDVRDAAGKFHPRLVELQMQLGGEAGRVRGPAYLQAGAVRGEVEHLGGARLAGDVDRGEQRKQPAGRVAPFQPPLHLPGLAFLDVEDAAEQKHGMWLAASADENKPAPRLGASFRVLALGPIVGIFAA